jgi:hypothetical protein
MCLVRFQFVDQLAGRPLCVRVAEKPQHALSGLVDGDAVDGGV